MIQRKLLINRLMPLALQTRAAWEDGWLTYPPSDVFSKKWLLCSVLDAFERNQQHDDSYSFSFEDGSTYIPDGLLESPFHKRYEGDHLAEPGVTVGAAVGRIEVEGAGSTAFHLRSDSRQFVVILPFLHDEAADGVPGFPWYNQVARTAAAMAYKAQICGFGAWEIPRTSLIVITPEMCSGNLLLGQYADKANIRNAVSSRMHGYREEAPECYGAMYDWYHEYFLPFLSKTAVEHTHWRLFMSNSGDLTPLMWFYFGCLCFNNPKGPKPGKWFARTIEEMRQRLIEEARSHDGD
jgi:hypothetical protein